jgi:hypothetical protein
MKVVPVANVNQIQTQPVVNEAKVADAKARALAVLTGTASQAAPTQGQAQETPVANPNNISTEELSALQVPAPQVEQTESDNNADTSEATTEEIREKAKRDPEQERRFQRLAQQERKFRSQVQQQNIELKRRDAALKQREAELEGRTAPQDLTGFISKDRLRQDYISAIEEAGGSYDELVQQVTNRRETDPRVFNTIQKLEDKIASLESKLDEGSKNATVQQQQAYQTAIKQIRADATELVTSDDNYSTVRDMNAVKDVVELIERKYKKDGTILSIEKACELVENHLIDETVKAANSKKVRERLAKSSATISNTATKPQQTQQQQLKTLTNSVSSQRQLTARERAIAAFEGKLKL